MTGVDRRAHHRVADALGPPIYATAVFVVIMGPAVVLVATGDVGGMGDAGDRLDLVWASLAVAALAAPVAWQRLRHEELVARWRADVWIASLNALVVLALSGPLLLMAVLYVFVDEHASLADDDYPVALLWFGIQVAAVALAEVTGRLVFWWLEPRRSGLLRWRLRLAAQRPDRGARVD